MCSFEFHYLPVDSLAVLSYALTLETWARFSFYVLLITMRIVNCASNFIWLV